MTRHDIERRVYAHLLSLSEPLPIEILNAEIAQQVGRSSEQVQGLVKAALDEGAERQWVVLNTTTRVELSRADGKAVSLPERVGMELLSDRVAGTLLTSDEMNTLCQPAGIPPHEVIRCCLQRSWLEKVKLPRAQETTKHEVRLRLTPAGVSVRERSQPDEILLGVLAVRPRVFMDELSSLGIDPEDSAIRSIIRRKEFVRVHERNAVIASLTDTGRRLAREPRNVTPMVTAYGAEEIANWEVHRFARYDVTLPAATVYPVKSHPLQRIIEEVRRAFFEMGFEETSSPLVESAFWDFDALFQPQDHPARDMQDTFYCSTPNKAALPLGDLVDRVRRTHEEGGDTGSTGWRYVWSEQSARQVVLRTHTTAGTIRALAENPKAPRKVFTVGRVFRNETVSATKLPEFTQVDGIVVDEAASLAMLLGTLRLFYRKMGFDRVRFKPAFFPYTEPSAEIYVYFDRLGWVEMGGSGVFRPEVTIPQGCTTPVLAWGLGLERLAMHRYAIDDIRALYQADIDWVRQVPLCL